MKRNYLLAIPSKNRKSRLELFLEKNLKNITNQGLDVVIALEKRDPSQKIKFENIKILTLKKNNQGISYSRNQLVKYAHKNRYSHILMVDDNVEFGKKEYPLFKKFLDCMDKNTKFLAAWNKYYELVGTMWGSCFGIDVKAAMKVGNYDVNLIYGEDKFLVVKLSKVFGINCFKSSNWISFGKHRGEKGGGQKFRIKRIHNQVIEYINKKYPDLFKKVIINKNNSMIMYPTFKLRRKHEPDFKRKI